MTTKTKKKGSKPDSGSLSFVFDGTVSIEHRSRTGKLLDKTEVPGEIVLQALVMVVEEAVRRYVELTPPPTKS